MIKYAIKKWIIIKDDWSYLKSVSERRIDITRRPHEALLFETEVLALDQIIKLSGNAGHGYFVVEKIIVFN